MQIGLGLEINVYYLTNKMPKINWIVLVDKEKHLTDSGMHL